MALALDQAGLVKLRSQLLQIVGVRTVEVVAMLPGAAVNASGVSESALRESSMQELIGDSGLPDALVDGGYHLPVREIELNGEPCMLETLPLHETGGRVAGAVMTLHAPSRMRERLNWLQNYDAGDLALAQAASPAGRDAEREVATLDEAVADFEKALLQRLYRDFPSSRRLAKRLGASHSAIAARLRRYGIG